MSTGATMTKTIYIGFPFTIAAILVLVFALDVVWWAAILVSLLASLQVKVTLTQNYVRKYNA